MARKLTPFQQELRHCAELDAERIRRGVQDLFLWQQTRPQVDDDFGRPGGSERRFHTLAEVRRRTDTQR